LSRIEEAVAADTPWREVYAEHPVGPVTGIDPLASFDPALLSADSVMQRPDPLRLGIAAFWEKVPQRTLSGSAWHLREALRGLTDTIDIGVEFPSLPRLALRAVHVRHRGGRLTTNWNNSRLTDAYVASALKRGTRKNSGGRDLDAVLMVDTIATVRAPFFIYYDSSWDALISSVVSLEKYAEMRRLTPSHVLRRRDRQLAIYERATGIIVFSHWLAHCLIEQSGVPPEKIHVIHPAAVAKPPQLDAQADGSGAQAADAMARAGQAHNDSPRRKLLYIGRLYESFDFYRKGGDLILEALQILRRDYDPQITLTMAGMEKWPLPGEPPDGVNFPGIVPASEVGRLYQTHDVFVMPSRAEPFGLVFAEALAWGMPCVARNAYAMPEVVTPGVSGALIEKDDADELAASIAAVLADDDLHKQCAARAPQIARYFSWERVAREVVQMIDRTVG
jgi:glycosyltransferase involved in cell wall biosynthesis